MPDGPLYLIVGNAGSSIYYYTSVHSIDLGRWLAGRSDASMNTPAQPAPLLVSCSLATPWADGDELDLFSFDVNGWATSEATTAVGASSVSALAAGWYGGLPRTQKGDLTYLYQLSNATTSQGQAIQSVKGAAVSSNVTLDAATITPVTFNMVATLPHENSQVRSHSNELAKLIAENPLITSPSPKNFRTAVFASPRAAELGLLAFSPLLLTAFPQSLDSDTDLTTSYANPFPASWSEGIILSVGALASFSINQEPASNGVLIPLQIGSSYVFVVSARMAGSQTAQTPNLTSLPNSLASSVTNTVRYTRAD